MSRTRDLRVIALGDSFVAGVGDPDCRGWFGRLASTTGRRGIPTTAYNLGVRRGAHPGAAGYDRLAALVLPTWLDWIGV